MLWKSWNERMSLGNVLATFLCSIIRRKCALLRWGGGGALEGCWFFSCPPLLVTCRVEFLPIYVTHFKQELICLFGWLIKKKRFIRVIMNQITPVLQYVPYCVQPLRIMQIIKTEYTAALFFITEHNCQTYLCCKNTVWIHVSCEKTKQFR